LPRPSNPLKTSSEFKDKDTFKEIEKETKLKFGLDGLKGPVVIVERTKREKSNRA
jgi:hypothetical protein